MTQKKSYTILYKNCTTSTFKYLTHIRSLGLRLFILWLSSSTRNQLILVTLLNITPCYSWVVHCWWHLAKSNLQRLFLVVSEGFFFSNHPKPNPQSTHLTMLVLTTTFKCFLKALLTSTTLFTPWTIMAFTYACLWGRIRLHGFPPLIGSS